MNARASAPAWLWGVVILLFGLVAAAALGLAALVTWRARDAPGRSAGEPPADPLAPRVELHFGGGCAPTMRPPFSVTRTDSQLHIASHAQSPVHAITIRPGQSPLRGRLPISTAQWRADGLQIGVMVGSRVWWNWRADARPSADPVSGALDFRAFDPEAGLVDVTFDRVSLFDPGTNTVCVVDGRVRTQGLRWER